MLKVDDHDRRGAGMKYVYPVLSRRAGGVSLGINLNVNNACNWACLYCQVPNLKRGAPPPVDLELLEHELRQLLDAMTRSDYLAENAPPGARKLVDVAFSGNGEPTAAPEFAAAVTIVSRVMTESGVSDEAETRVKLRLITNGSFLHRATVREGIAAIGAAGGEVWFKLDRATRAGIARINGVRLDPERVRRSLRHCAALAPTWVQTCFFALDGLPPDAEECAHYLDFLRDAGTRICGVHLYGLARPSRQKEADRLSVLSQDGLKAFAERISSLGVKVVVSH